MQQGKQHNNQEIISMEEYLNKRQEIRERETKKKKKSPAFMLAELYV